MSSCGRGQIDDDADDNGSLSYNDLNNTKIMQNIFICNIFFSIAPQEKGTYCQNTTFSTFALNLKYALGYNYKGINSTAVALTVRTPSH